MATCSAETLLASGACFSQLSQRGLQIAIAQLLCAILNGNDPMAVCDIEALLNSARCMDGLSDKQIILVQTQLLCEIQQGGGGGTPLTVEEQDGTPTVPNVTTITVSNGTLTDDGGGVVSVVTGGGGGGGLSGAGSPEGVVAASPGATFWDITGQSLWIKDTGVGNVGWVQVVA